MKKAIISFSVIFVFLLFPCCAQKKGRIQKNTSISKEDEISYALGMQIGKYLSLMGSDSLINIHVLTEGLKDQINKNPLLDSNSIDDMIYRFHSNIHTTQSSKGITFLTENAQQEGINITSSGLQYKIMIDGTGPLPKFSDSVVAHYCCKTIDGNTFEDTYQTGEPLIFSVTDVINSWQEALQLMPVGSKWMLYVDPALSLNGKGSGTILGSNEPLIYEIELIGIVQ